jgi:hypothetical protein
MEMETTHSLRSCEHNGLPSLVPDRVSYAGVTGVWDQPPFVASGTLHDSGSEKADTLSTPPVNRGTTSKMSLRLSLVA